MSKNNNKGFFGNLKEKLSGKTEEEKPINDPSDESQPSYGTGNGVNSTPAEIKKLGGIEKLRARINAKRELAKLAKQPRV
jgi:hypothetical protein